MILSINKSGVIEAGSITEFIANTFDTNTYIEPDGSAWIRIFHHNNPATSLFSSSDTFTSNVYKDANRWFNVALCNYLSNSWEFMIKQKQTSSSTEEKYRWIQTSDPMNGSFDSTKAANITKITTAGYSTFANAGGIYKMNSGAFLVINNSVSGNWFGAVGSWTAYSGGIPGYPNTAITSGYMDLYLRIDNAKANIKATSFDPNFIKTREIQEY